MNASEHYWQRIFRGNPELCSWQAGPQARVRDAVQSRLNEAPGARRILDFGIGNLGLYRALDHDLMRRITLLGISESQQHDTDDPLFDRSRIQILIGPGITPFARVAPRCHDHVVCTYVFAYLSEQARAEALRCLARVLVPGGRLTLVLHHPRGARARKLQASHTSVPHAAWQDCEDTQRLIDRERAMTCDSFRPVADPLVDLPLPDELGEITVSEHVNPLSGRPIANLLCASKAGARRSPEPR